MGCGTSKEPVQPASTAAAAGKGAVKNAADVTVSVDDGRASPAGAGSLDGRPRQAGEAADSMLKPRRRGSVEDVGGRRARRRVAFSAEVMRQTINERRFDESGAAGTEEVVYKPSTAAGVTREPSPKDVITTERIRASLSDSFLFRDLATEALTELIAFMFKAEFKKGELIIEQGAMPKDEDRMYVIEDGTCEITLKGNPKEQAWDFRGNRLVNVYENKTEKAEERTIATKGPGDNFGDIALLFTCPRTASVRATSDLSVWALDRVTFTSHMLVHSTGTQRLCFLREVPLLQNLPDNVIRALAERVTRVTIERGEKVITRGERGEELFLVESGEVLVEEPSMDDPKSVEKVCTYRRADFFGERSLVSGMRRTADVTATEDSQLLKLEKKDFVSLMPLLHNVLEDNMKFTVLRSVPILRGLTPEQMEDVIDMFDTQTFKKGEVVIREGDAGEGLYIVKAGVVECFKLNGGQQEFQRDYEPYTYFGERALLNNQPRAASCVAKSDKVELLHLSREHFNVLLGPLMKVVERNKQKALLKSSPALKSLSDRELDDLMQEVDTIAFEEQEVIIKQGEDVVPPRDRFYIVQEGECVVTKSLEKGEPPKELMRLTPGAQFGERALLTAEPRAANVIAATHTTCIYLTRQAFEKHLGPLKEIMEAAYKEMEQRKTELSMNFWDLEDHGVVGIGQFGQVSVVRHKFTQNVYALKCMKKVPIVRYGQVDHVKNEKMVMELLDHPFIVKLVRAFVDSASLYFLLEMVQGGELFRLLDIEGNFQDSVAKFYAGCVLLAFEHMHSHGIVYRDLKPENCLVDARGYLKVADFGFAKKVDNGQTYTMCGTPDYQAPEIITRKGHDVMVDYWAVGVLVYEMLVGDPPFSVQGGNNDPRETFKRILDGRYSIPPYVSDEAADLVWHLLQNDPRRRLGARNQAKDIKKHKWFQSLDFAALERKKIPAPFLPEIRNPLDRSNFDDYSDVEAQPNAPMEDTDYPWKDWTSCAKTQ